MCKLPVSEDPHLRIRCRAWLDRCSADSFLISPVYIWPSSSEPGLAPSLARCLAPIRGCLHYRGRAPRQLDHLYGRPQFASCRACADRVFFYFDNVTELRWLVCNNYENSNLKKLFDVALFVNSRRHNSADNSLRIVWSLLRFCTTKVYDVRKLRWHN